MDDVDTDRIGPSEPNDDGEPVEITWETNWDVDLIVTKAGEEDTEGDREPGMQNHYFDDVNEGSVNAYGTDAGDEESPSSPCPADADGVKYEWDEDADSFETSD